MNSIEKHNLQSLESEHLRKAKQNTMETGPGFSSNDKPSFMMPLTSVLDEKKLFTQMNSKRRNTL